MARRCALLTCALLAGCADVPRDAEGTLERVRGGVLMAGVTDSPPWIRRSGDYATGPEAELVREVADSLDARVTWRWGPLEDHLAALERFEIDLVAGGLPEQTPWRHRVGLTRPWIGGERGGRVLAVPPGENGFLVMLERHIVARERRSESRVPDGP